MFLLCIFVFVLCLFVCIVDEVVVLICFGMIVVMSGFIGLGYLKVVLVVFVVYIDVVYVCGEDFWINVLMGVLIVLEFDGVFVCIDGILMWLLY